MSKKIKQSLFLSEEEYEKLLKDAEALGMTPEEYLEDLVKRKLQPN
ncbi:hypothetical protein ACFL2C_01240 [Patescibacteria group bacterium]